MLDLVFFFKVLSVCFFPFRCYFVILLYTEVKRYDENKSKIQSGMFFFHVPYQEKSNKGYVLTSEPACSQHPCRIYIFLLFVCCVCLVFFVGGWFGVGVYFVWFYIRFWCVCIYWFLFVLLLINFFCCFIIVCLIPFGVLLCF